MDEELETAKEISGYNKLMELSNLYWEGANNTVMSVFGASAHTPAGISAKIDMLIQLLPKPSPSDQENVAAHVLLLSVGSDLDDMAGAS